MTQQGAALQTYNNELVKCRSFTGFTGGRRVIDMNQLFIISERLCRPTKGYLFK